MPAAGGRKLGWCQHLQAGVCIPRPLDPSSVAWAPVQQRRVHPPPTVVSAGVPAGVCGSRMVSGLRQPHGLPWLHRHFIYGAPLPAGGPGHSA